MKTRPWIYSILLSILCCIGCSEQQIPIENDNENSSESGNTSSDNENENSSTGVLLLGRRLDNPERGALAYIAPDGSFEEDIWQKVNGTMLADQPQDLCISNGKLYILCATDGDEEETDGGLIIADASTFKKEKTFPISTIEYEKPEGTGPQFKPLLKNPTNLAVLDERNVFIKDQGLFRFDTTTGKMTAVKGTYHIANTISGNGNLEAKVTSKGLVIMNDKLYIGSAGFWNDQSGVMEIVANKDEVNRVLEIPVDLVTGLTSGNDNNLLLAHYVRGTKRSNKITTIDLETFQTAETIAKPTGLSISPGFFDKSGVTFDGDNYLYLSEIEETETKVNYMLTLNRINLSDGTSETLADFKQEVPEAKYLTTNPVMDRKNKYLYVSVADNMYEGQPSTGYLLIYDCSQQDIVLKQKISGKTCKTVGIYFTDTTN